MTKVMILYFGVGRFSFIHTLTFHLFNRCLIPVFVHILRIHPFHKASNTSIETPFRFKSEQGTGRSYVGEIMANVSQAIITRDRYRNIYSIAFFESICYGQHIGGHSCTNIERMPGNTINFEPEYRSIGYIVYINKIARFPTVFEDVYAIAILDTRRENRQNACIRIT